MQKDIYKMIEELHKLVTSKDFILMRVRHSTNNLSEAHKAFSKALVTASITMSDSEFELSRVKKALLTITR